MVVARRFGLYGSCAKRAFTRSRGVVFSSIDMCVDFKLRRLEVIYVKPGIFRGGGGGGGVRSGGGWLLMLLWWVER